MENHSGSLFSLLALLPPATAAAFVSPFTLAALVGGRFLLSLVPCPPAASLCGRVSSMDLFLKLSLRLVRHVWVDVFVFVKIVCAFPLHKAFALREYVFAGVAGSVLPCCKP